MIPWTPAKLCVGARTTGRRPGDEPRERRNVSWFMPREIVTITLDADRMAELDR